MDNPLMDVEGARERLEEWKTRAEQRATETRAASDGLRALRVTAADDNGIADVTVDSSGALVDIQLSSRIQRQAPDHTQTAILGAYRNARRKLAEAAAEVVSGTVGSESATGRALLAGFQGAETPER